MQCCTIKQKERGDKNHEKKQKIIENNNVKTIMKKYAIIRKNIMMRIVM